ncbi:MAG: phosphotransferase [Candidatus Dojkabacteria bacterium]
MRKQELQKEISSLLKVELKDLEFDYEKGFQKVNEITAIDLQGNKTPLILKRRKDRSEFAFYEEFLSKYDVDSPKWYGYIQINEYSFLLIKRVAYMQPMWGGYASTKLALKWLIKKDTICQQHAESIKKMTSLGKMQWYGIDDWMYEIEVGSKNKVHPIMTEDFWDLLSSQVSPLQDVLKSLENSNHSTISHGDLQMGNILFATDSSTKVYVIDWTQPHVTSMCRDVAQLVDYVPENQRLELIEAYKKEFYFEEFEQECRRLVQDY